MLAESATAGTRSFSATPDHLPEIDAWIDAAGAKLGFDPDMVFRARVCVAEIAANLLEHGRSRPEGDDIRITLRPAPPALHLEISDSGREFDPTLRRHDVTEPGASSGRGLRLVRAYASMSYRRTAGRNVLSLRVAPAPRGPSHESPG